MSKVNKVVQEYYGEKLSQFGPNSRGIDWRDIDSHVLRHQVISDFIFMGNLVLS